MTTTRRVAASAASLAAALALPAAASAHVTVNPAQVPAGAETELAVRVPTESDTASTTKVAVQLPPGFVTVSYEAEPGWRATVKKSKLAKPVVTDDGTVTEQVDSITWTGTGKGDGAIPPGAFKDFPISVAVPGKAGDVLTFKAVQTYSDGSVVRWIGAPDADSPAPRVTLLPAASTSGVATAEPGSPATAPVSDVAAPVDPGKSASKGLGLAALIVGLIGALFGGAALLTTRKA